MDEAYEGASLSRQPMFSRADFQESINTRLDALMADLQPPRLAICGKLVEMTGLTLVANGCKAAVGSRCLVQRDNHTFIEAEVVGFSGQRSFLMPVTRVTGLSCEAAVIPLHSQASVAVGPQLLGRVLDSCGKALDGLPEPDTVERYPMIGQPINPFKRQPIRVALDVGIRVINALLTVGCGQRVGLFAGSGVGKSVLLGQMTRYTAADIVVVGLIGERGREVREFVEDVLGPEGLRRAIVVASPADDPPLLRMHGAWRATAIAEYFRDQGFKVLLLMDSLSRFAQAQRELALSIGEAPVSKGYPSSVFALLPQLVERAGNASSGSGGSITAFYTVLAEGDDQQDPIADACRAILDGHIVLSRDIAQQGIYPAISVEESISRLMEKVTPSAHRELAAQLKSMLGNYEKNRDLITIGAYRGGSDPALDYAVERRSQFVAYLSQSVEEKADLQNSVAELAALLKDYIHA